MTSEYPYHPYVNIKKNPKKQANKQINDVFSDNGPHESFSVLVKLEMKMRYCSLDGCNILGTLTKFLPSRSHLVSEAKGLPI